MKSVFEQIKLVSMRTQSRSGHTILDAVPAVFDVSHRTACVTNYENLYIQGSAIQRPDQTCSYVEEFPVLLRRLARDLDIDNLLTIGGGNRSLVETWRAAGRKAISLGCKDKLLSYSKNFDLSLNTPTQSMATVDFLRANLGANWITTCLDVAEQIDSEHLADFLLNLRVVTGSYLLISVKTCPSLQANLFHSTVIPTETWKKLFLAVGFDVKSETDFNEIIQHLNFTGVNEDMISISHWQKINPFHDINYHQHYFLLKKKSGTRFNLPALRKYIAEILDISYRWEKRRVDLAFPELTYSVNFIQDWAFVRSLMDVWPSHKLRITLRADCISQAFQKIIHGYLKQKGIDYTTLLTVDSANELLSSQDPHKQIWMTATGGNHSITHQLNSVLMRNAREKGFRTVTLQHGMTVPTAFSPTTEFIGVWDEKAKDCITPTLAVSSPQQVCVLGSPKLLDAMLPQSNDAIENRFGIWTQKFKKKYLIGLSLHWNVHQHKNKDTYAWLKRITSKNPDCLFFIKPHPDDSSIYDFITSNPSQNILLVDDILLISMDWSLMRLLKAVDGLITTHSTLILDALAAQTPVACLPVDDSVLMSSGVKNASFPTDDFTLVPLISDEEWNEGTIPRCLEFLPDYYKDTENLQNSLYFYENLVKLLTLDSKEDGWESVDTKATEALFFSARHLNLSQNPHREMQSIDEAIEIFVS
ncbi:capsular polysaccharide export protein, LipB/KpsS family [Brucella anthropi]|uniref:capsular polysaccharide export protein, LipB/KpsS family n=1 Tax=Brucella anthropi TaxID=529 RepID=UPI00124C0B22|nr:hypothetical protein [Brucella anthropi]KAB2777289.1 hypothetical protein F9K99_19645 [Brucella anthropi]